MIPRYAVGEVVVPQDARGALLAPYEAETGTPLPIVMADAPGGGVVRRWNRHHAHFEAKDYLNGTLATRAVRFSRLQYLPMWLHDRYHQVHEVLGTRFPQSTEQELTQTVLGCVGYVPEWGVDVSGSQLAIVHLSEPQREQLQQPGVFRTERQGRLRAEIGQYLMECALSQDFSHVEPWLVDKFVSIKPRDARRSHELRAEKMRIGMRLIGKGIEVATADQVEPQFQKARREQALKVGAPVCSWLFIRNYIGNYATDYIRTLEYRLRLGYYRSKETLQTGVNPVQ